MKIAVAANVNEYINTFPKTTQKVLEQVRKTIKKAAPASKESINYAMPVYKLNGNHLFILQDMKITLGYMPHHQGMLNLKKNYLNINRERARCSFH